jgi:hypothetical protein
MSMRQGYYIDHTNDLCILDENNIWHWMDSFGDWDTSQHPWLWADFCLFLGPL